MIEFTLRNFYEGLPIPLAWAVLLYIGYRFIHAHSRRNGDLVNFVLGAILCVLYILAQTGWFIAVATNNSDDKYFSDMIWSLFNTVVLIHVFYNVQKVTVDASAN